MTTSLIEILFEIAIDALKALTHMELARMHWRHGDLATRNELYASAACIATRLGRTCTTHGLPMPACFADSAPLRQHFQIGQRDQRSHA